MIKIYGMKTCPDCIAVDKHVEGDNRYEIIDIGSHIKSFSTFVIIIQSLMMLRNMDMLASPASYLRMVL